MVLGEHCSLLMVVEPAPVTISTRSLSRVTSDTARATAELITSVIMSTPSVSYHSRARLAATSVLFWWSAVTTSTLKPGFCSATKSSTAMRAAVTAPSPLRSEKMPDMSASTPIFTVSPEMPLALSCLALSFAPATALASRAMANRLFVIGLFMMRPRFVVVVLIVCFSR